MIVVKFNSDTMTVGTDYWGLIVSGMYPTLTITDGDPIPCSIDTGMIKCYLEYPKYTSDNIHAGGLKVRVEPQ